MHKTQLHIREITPLWFCLGIILSYFTNSQIALLFGIFGLFCLSLIDNFFHKYILILLLGIAVGSIIQQKRIENDVIYNKIISIEGEVLKEFKTENGYSYIIGNLKINEKRKEYKIKLFSNQSLYSGNVIYVREKIKQYQDIFPYGYSTVKNLARNNIFGYLRSNDVRIKDAKINTDSLIRKRFRDRIFKRFQDHDIVAFVLAITTGDTGYLSKNLRNNIANSGCAHVLAISGLHITIIAYFFHKISRYILTILFPSFIACYDVSKFCMFFGCSVACFYVWLSGMMISATRSIIMFCMLFIGTLFDKITNPIRNLVFALCVFCLFFPQDISSISFQMSFLATFVIISCYSNYDTFNKQHWFYNLFRYIVTCVSSSFITSVAISPLEAYYFNRIPVMAPLGNLLILPIVEFIILPFSFLLLFFDHSFMYDLIQYCVNIVYVIANIISNVSFSYILVPQIHGYFAIYLTLIVIIMMFLHKKHRLYLLSLAILSVFCYWYFYKYPNKIETPDGKNLVHYKDGKFVIIRGNKFILNRWNEKLGNKLFK